MWRSGDPSTDIDGDPRPSGDGSPDFAGADIPSIPCNETPFEAELFRFVARRPALARGGGRQGDGRVRRERPALARPLPIPVIRAPKSIDGFELETDGTLAKPAVDILAIGNARPLARASTREMLVGFTVGDLHARLGLGDRHWHKAASAWRPSDALPFEVDAGQLDPRLRRGLAQAGHARAAPREPQGQRLRRRPARARRGPPAPEHRGRLAEDPVACAPAATARVRAADFDLADPRPALACASARGLVDLASLLQRRAPTLADPRARGRRRLVRLFGWHPHAVAPFVLPSVGLVADVRIEDRDYQYPFRLDGLCMFPNENRFTLTWRCVFSYAFVRRARRVVRSLAARCLVEIARRRDV